MDESSREWRVNIKYISLFSGIEAATVAWEPLGWEPLAFCEIEDFPSAVLSYHYPDVPNLGDICKVDWKDVIERHGRPDVVVGGSPCQSFSVAGGRESLDGESRLMFEYIRALAEIRPTWFLWENVPGVLNTRDDAFSQLLGEVQNIGYLSLAWRVLDAQFFGVAQRRRRVFLVGHLGTGGGAASVLFESESVRGNTQTSKQKREELARTAGRGANAGGGEGNLSIDYKQTPKVNEEISHTLTHEGNGGIHSSVLQSAGFCGYASHTASSIGYQEEQSPTLKGNDWQCQVPDVLQATAIRTANTGANGSGITEECAHTIDCAQPEAVAFAQNTRNEVRLQGGDGSVSGHIAASDSAKGQGVPFVMTNYGNEVAGTLTSRADSSPSPMGGQNIVCQSFVGENGGDTNMGLSDDCSPTIIAKHPVDVLCMASAAANAEIGEQICPTIMAHAAKTPPIVLSSNADVVGALCARDYKGVGKQYVEEGKVICQRVTSSKSVAEPIPTSSGTARLAPRERVR